MKAARFKHENRPHCTMIVKEDNDYFDWYDSGHNVWEKVEEFEV